MNYFDPSTGNILTYEQIVAEAGTTPVAEYMLQKGYQRYGIRAGRWFFGITHKKI